MKKIFLVFGLGLLCLPNVSLADNQNIYISQVQTTDGSGKTTEDFIELFNPNSQPVNLNGFRLVKRTATANTDTSIKSWTSDTYIPPYSFYLWANSSFISISVTPDATTTGSIADDNGIALRNGPNDTGVIIDSVAWGNTNNSFNNISTVNPAAAQSLIRQDLFSTSSLFSVGSSSPHNSSISRQPVVLPQVPPVSTSTPPAATSTPTSTPPSSGGAVPTFKRDGSIVISEILPNPLGEDSGQEKIELLNTGLGQVSLEGWMLDDKSTGGPKPSALTLSSIISPGQFLVIVIPKGFFTLNNSGGDSVNLYYPDKTLADSVSYSESAAENISYQKVGNNWIWAPQTLGEINAKQDLPQQTDSYKISLSEFMPNPLGQDEGKEWVEVYNPNNFAVNLKGFILDDSGSGAPGSSGLQLSDGLVVSAGGYLQIIIPEGNFTLGNSGDSLRLFDPNKNLLETVSYKDAPEGESYSKDKNGNWQFGLPTPGLENFVDLPEFNLIISEILPNPNQQQDEFVEIANPTDSAISLENFVLYVGDKKKVFDSSAKVSANGFYAIYEDDLPARLRNSGQTVKLVDLYGRTAAQVKYPEAIQGQSYASNDGKNYVWTESVTPELANEFVLGEQTTVPSASNKKVTAVTKTAAEITKAQAKELLADNKDLKQQIAILQDSVNALDQKLVLAQSPGSALKPESVQNSESINKKPLPDMLILPIALALVGGVIFFGFKQLKK